MKYKMFRIYCKFENFLYELCFLRKPLDDFLRLKKKKQIKSKNFQSCWFRNILYFINMTNILIPGAQEFVDLGSGIGKVISVVERRSNFRQVIGIEKDPELSKISKLYLVNRKKNSYIKILNMDVLDYKCSTSRTIYFMFNPFDRSTLEKFLSLNKVNLEKSKSSFIYINDMNREEFKLNGANLVFRNEKLSSSIWLFGEYTKEVTINNKLPWPFSLWILVKKLEFK